MTILWRHVQDRGILFATKRVILRVYAQDRGRLKSMSNSRNWYKFDHKIFANALFQAILSVCSLTVLVSTASDAYGHAAANDSDFAVCFLVGGNDEGYLEKTSGADPENPGETMQAYRLWWDQSRLTVNLSSGVAEYYFEDTDQYIHAEVNFHNQAGSRIRLFVVKGDTSVSISALEEPNTQWPDPTDRIIDTRVYDIIPCAQR